VSLRLIAAAAAALLLLGAGAAEAGKGAKAKTSGEISGYVAFDETFLVFGDIDSTERRCVENRRVTVILRGSKGTVKIDRARTGRSGGWAATRDLEKVMTVGNFRHFLVKVDERTVRSGGKTVLCKPLGLDAAPAG